MSFTFLEQVPEVYTPYRYPDFIRKIMYRLIITSIRTIKRGGDIVFM